MKAKGVAVGSIPEFVRTCFPDGFRPWLSSLPESSRTIFENPIATDGWYPIDEAVIVPTQSICDTFYEKDPAGAWEAGRFSAQQALKSVHRIFIKVGSPLFVVDRAAGIFTAYYRPSRAVVAEKRPDRAVIHLVEFGRPHDLVDRRIAGWIEMALELSGCENLTVSITQSLAHGDPQTEFVAEWG